MFIPTNGSIEWVTWVPTSGLQELQNGTLTEGFTSPLTGGLKSPWHPSAMVWMFTCSHFCQIPMLKSSPPKFILVLVGGAFGNWSGHKVGALMNGISALLKEILSEGPSNIWGHNKIYNPEDSPYLTMLSPWSQTFRLQNCKK